MNLDEHSPAELSGRMDMSCEPGPAGRHQARMPAELWQCGQSDQTSALVISLYSHGFKFSCKTGYSGWFEHVALEQPRLRLPSADLWRTHTRRQGLLGVTGVRGPACECSGPRRWLRGCGREAGRPVGTELPSGKSEPRKHWRRR